MKQTTIYNTYYTHVQTKGDFEIWVYFIQGNGCDMCDTHERRHLGIKPLILQVET